MTRFFALFPYLDEPQITRIIHKLENNLLTWNRVLIILPTI